MVYQIIYLLTNYLKYIFLCLQAPTQDYLKYVLCCVWTLHQLTPTSTLCLSIDLVWRIPTTAAATTATTAVAASATVTTAPPAGVTVTGPHYSLWFPHYFGRLLTFSL